MKDQRRKIIGKEMNRIILKIKIWLADYHCKKKNEVRKVDDTKIHINKREENRHYLHSKPNNEASVRHQLEEKRLENYFLFRCLQAKLWLKINAKSCSW